MAKQQRLRIIPDNIYAKIIDVLDNNARHKDARKWKKKGYSVRGEVGNRTLHLLDDTTPAKGRGATVAKAELKAEPEIEDLTKEDDVPAHAPAPVPVAAASLSSSPAPASPPPPSPPSDSKWKLVPKQSNVLRYIEETHRETKHAGIHQTFTALNTQYVGIPRVLIVAHIARCATCITKAAAAKNSKPAIMSISSSRFNERVQIDLFDMQQTPGGPLKDYKFVLHSIDHFTRFSILRPLKTKEAAGVAAELRSIWCLFGAPDILQSDNGGEFNNAAIDALCKQFNVNKLNGRAFHPATQGKVERANQLAKQKLLCWSLDGEAGADWLIGLDEVQMEMNRHERRSLRRTPYELVFNRKHSTAIATEPTSTQQLHKRIREEQKETQLSKTVGGKRQRRAPAKLNSID